MRYGCVYTVIYFFDKYFISFMCLKNEVTNVASYVTVNDLLDLFIQNKPSLFNNKNDTLLGVCIMILVCLNC